MLMLRRIDTHRPDIETTSMDVDLCFVSTARSTGEDNDRFCTALESVSDLEAVHSGRA